MQSKLIIDVKDFPQLDGQQVGRELDLEITGVVTAVAYTEGGPPSLLGVTLHIIRADITQTT